MRVPFAQYAEAYQHVRMRRDGGIIELTLHTGGGPLVWGDGPHSELGHCFADVGSDPDNRIVILTGAGDSFIAELDDSWVGAMTPALWNRIFHNGHRLLLALLDIEVPVIGVINGPARVHAELGLLSDIVLASETADFKDAPHFRYGTVPGDGAHVIWPALLGQNRGRYFLLTGQRLTAREALALGVVNEIHPPGLVLDRAWQLAGELARQPDTTLRYTRAAMTASLKRAVRDGLTTGLALEGLGAHGSWPSTR